MHHRVANFNTGRITVENQSTNFAFEDFKQFSCLAEIGIGAEDQAGFLEAIKRGQQEVRQRLNTAIKQRADAEIEIDRLNKSISEAEKTKSASVFANSAIGGSEELSKAVLNIDKRLSELKLGLEAQIALANGLVLTADDLRNQYLTLCKLVN